MLIQGDARVLPLRDESVHCVVTSPPYWGLRDYGTGRWLGGDAACDHVELAVGMSAANTLGPDRHLPATNAANVGRVRQFRDVCKRCGAQRFDSQIGLEGTPAAYVEALVAVCRELRRVLRPDGTLWLNLGDSYANTGNATQTDFSASEVGYGRRGRAVVGGQPSKSTPDGLKAKDLVGIPWRVAFALQADGWLLRSDIIWAKRNCMPESVTDRPTRAHEYVFLLTRRPRYFYDAKAIREAARPETAQRYAYAAANGRMNAAGAYAEAESGIDDHGMNHARTRNPKPPTDGKANARTVWSLASEPYRGAHFATFPTALVKRCILAGCPVGGVVLDPFVGSGTTVRVARDLGRHGVGLDLNRQYLVEQARGRTSTTMGLAL